jgi:hypothetical protein
MKGLRSWLADMMRRTESSVRIEKEVELLPLRCNMSKELRTGKRTEHIV